MTYVSDHYNDKRHDLKSGILRQEASSSVLHHQQECNDNSEGIELNSLDNVRGYGSRIADDSNRKSL